VSDRAPAREAADASEGPVARATVFMSDPSAEAEHVAQLLRATGYVVVDVPMSMLVARVAVQKPGVIVIDADVAGAAEAVTAVRALDGGGAIDVLLLGQEGALGGQVVAALATDIRGFFARPVDPTVIVRKIDALTSGGSRGSSRPSAPPPRASESSPPIAGSGSAPPAASSVHPGSVPPSVAAPSSRSPASSGASLRWLPDRRSPIPPAALAPLSARPPPIGNPPRDGAASIRPAISIQASLSAELEALLVDAEQRIGAQAMHDALPPTPEEELATVLPAELLAALDEPLETDDDDSAADGALSRISPPSAHGTTGVAFAQTNAGHALTPAVAEFPAPHTVAAFAPPPGGWSRAEPEESSRVVDARAKTVAEAPEPTQGPSSIGVAPTLSAPALAAMSSMLGRDFTPLPGEVTAKPPSTVEGPATLLAPGDPPRLLASAVSSRASGSLAFEGATALRRVVLRDGDVVTAASSAEDETLLAFMISRGDLRRDQVSDLAGKIAPFGRHAGAALVAHGLLRQDQLWTALRAHAEWVLGRTLSLDNGTARIEAEPPGRLRQEPSVFGGSSGAEVLVELARRVIAPEEAVRRLGGQSAHVTEGTNVTLATECALTPEERALLDEARGQTLGDLLGRATGLEIAPVLYMLSLLGVVSVAPFLAPSSRGSTRGRTDDDIVSEGDVIALDITAVREHVRARYELVCEADYFTLLGVARDATGYEVRRAFLELRRAFEPSRILTPEMRDLEADVRTIVTVLDEAYEILKDSARRERYRRALGDAP
jgi:hypothetical protein